MLPTRLRRSVSNASGICWMRTFAACSHPRKAGDPRMKPKTNTNIRKLHDLGQRICLDNITRETPNNGTLARYIADLSVTGPTPNAAILENAIGSGDLYDAAIQKPVAQGREALGRLEPRRVKAHYRLPLDHRQLRVKDLLHFKTPIAATQRAQVVDRQAASTRCPPGAAAPRSSLIARPRSPAPSRLSIPSKSCRCSRCSRAAQRSSCWWPSSMRRFPLRLHPEVNDPGKRPCLIP